MCVLLCTDNTILRKRYNETPGHDDYLDMIKYRLETPANTRNMENHEKNQKNAQEKQPRRQPNTSQNAHECKEKGKKKKKNHYKAGHYISLHETIYTPALLLFPTFLTSHSTAPSTIPLQPSLSLTPTLPSSTALYIILLTLLLTSMYPSLLNLSG